MSFFGISRRNSRGKNLLVRTSRTFTAHASGLSSRSTGDSHFTEVGERHDASRTAALQAGGLHLVRFDRGAARHSPAVGVLEADDVVFAEIGAGLNLDDLQRQLARILQAVLGAGRDVGRLVFG